MSGIRNLALAKAQKEKTGNAGYKKAYEAEAKKKQGKKK